MKKIYLLSFALFAALLNVKAQSAFELKDLTGTGSLVSNSAIINRTTAAGLQTAHLFEIKNVSTSTKTIVVRRYDDVLNTVSTTDHADATFCLGTSCYPPSVVSGTVVLLPNATTTLTTDLDEASVVGESNIRYKVYDGSNSTDALTFTIKYNGPVSVKENINLFSNVSDAFPNPTASKSYINITVGVSTEVKLSIINSLGAIVSSKTVELTVGKNTLVLENENLPTGLYFVTISKGNQTITKKITISK